jgi:hypothetical protein
MEAPYSSETTISAQKTTRCLKPENQNMVTKFITKNTGMDKEYISSNFLDS